MQINYITGPSMCSSKNKSLVRRRESLLSLHFVAMIRSLCPIVSMQHPIFFVLFYLYGKCRWWRNFCIFPPIKNCKKHHFPVNAIQSFWPKSLSKPCNTVKKKYIEVLLWTSDEHANRCKRKSSSCMQRLSKYKQKLFMHLRET